MQRSLLGQMPVLVATAKQEAIEAEAESLGVMKEDLHGKLKYFRVSGIERFHHQWHAHYSNCMLWDGGFE